MGNQQVDGKNVLITFDSFVVGEILEYHSKPVKSNTQSKIIDFFLISLALKTKYVIL